MYRTVIILHFINIKKRKKLYHNLLVNITACFRTLMRTLRLRTFFVYVNGVTSFITSFIDFCLSKRVKPKPKQRFILQIEPKPNRMMKIQNRTALAWGMEVPQWGPGVKRWWGQGIWGTEVPSGIQGWAPVWGLGDKVSK